MTGLRAGRAGLLERWRAGGREISWVPESMRLGNVLSQWLWAHDGRLRDVRRLVLRTERVAAWLDLFARARDELSIDEADVRRRDRRVHPWLTGDPDETIDDYFDSGVMADFVERYVLSAPFLSSAAGQAALDIDRLVVNVRRGDYYVVPEYNAEFGFEIVDYLRVAVARALAEAGPAPGIHVVSDDAAWCREHLSWLADHTGLLTFSDPADPAAQNLVEVALARRLVVTNSTFSYWAGYISNVRHGAASQVVAPRFFRRGEDGGRWNLRRSWSIVEEIPAGWDSPGR